MLISADVKGLEVVAGAFLSQDKILMSELIAGVDVHGVNQHDILGLPNSKENRKVAKRFKFKMLYGGTPNGFANDADFAFLRWNVKKWHKIKDAYYEKYIGIRDWHRLLIDQVMHDGQYNSPTGRVYDYRELLKREDWYYVPKIKNYPVQGLGADIVMLARIDLFDRWKPEYGLLVNTIHDSIIIDTPKEMRYNIIDTVKNVFVDLPSSLNKSFDLNWNLPLEVELKTIDGKDIE